MNCKKKPRVGMMLVGVGSNFCGGAERFFADLYDEYNRRPETEHELWLITDATTLGVLSSLGKIVDRHRVIVLREIHHRMKKIVEAWDFMTKMVLNRIAILHVSSYTRHYFSRLQILDRMPRSIRPLLVVNIVSARLAHTYFDAELDKKFDDRGKYGPLFERIHIDGIYCWNRLFAERAEQYGWIRSQPLMDHIRTRFTLPGRFRPAAGKKKHIVFACRLVPAKRPFFFIDAIDHLVNSLHTPLNGWKFFIYGRGPLLGEIREAVIARDLGEVLVVNDQTPDMAAVFSESRCFVSTQEFDNFPSLSINEAMLCGNAIIARRVGQTEEFVRHMENGLLPGEDTPEALAGQLAYYIGHPELHDAMQAASIRLATEVHTPEKFIHAIDRYWSKILGHKQTEFKQTANVN